MQFLIDAQLAPALADALQRTGHDAVHVADLGMVSAADREIWDATVARGAVLVTKDRDFALRRAVVRKGPTVLWVRTGNSRNQDLIARVIKAWPRLLAAIERGDPVIEFLGH